MALHGPEKNYRYQNWLHPSIPQKNEHYKNSLTFPLIQKKNQPAGATCALFSPPSKKRQFWEDHPSYSVANNHG